MSRATTLLVCLFILLVVAGCAADFKLTGPSLSWRSGAGKAADSIARQPLGGHSVINGTGSAACSSPASD